MQLQVWETFKGFRAETGGRYWEGSEWVRPCEIAKCPCAISQSQSCSEVWPLGSYQPDNKETGNRPVFWHS